jgi:hypothetical protein
MVEALLTMSNRQLLLGVLSILALVLIIGPIGYYSLKNAEIEKEKAVETEKIKQDAETKRNENRWKILNTMPWVEKKES